MANSIHINNPLEGNKHDSSPTTIKFGENKLEENKRREWLKYKKPHVYNKVIQFNDKLARGEGVPIIQFQYNYECNFKCEHCSIEKFQMTRKEEKESGRRYFNMDDVRELSKQADEMGISTFVITGGEPLIFRDFDELVEAIDPNKFWIVSDTNGWNLDDERAKHLKEIGVDKIQLSLDGVDATTHDQFRRQAGSWERVMRAIEACKKNDLHVILSTVVWKSRAQSEEFLQYLELAKKLGVGTYVSYAKPVGAYEGRYDQMVTAEDEAYLKELEKKYDVFTHLTPSYGMDIGCIAVKRILPITRYGDVMPCPYIHVSLGNFFEESLKEIIDRGLNLNWFNPKVKMPCVCGVDRSFIDQVVVPSYGDVQVPVHYTEIFSAEDYVNPEKEKTLGLGCNTGGCSCGSNTKSGNSNNKDQIIETIETKDGVIPITWAPPEDTRYKHKLEGEPEYIKDQSKPLKLWDAPSNIKDREGKLHYQRKGNAKANQNAGHIINSAE
ncbi:MAG: radical SAM protein [Bacteroidetes bacterium]|nr:radical SAM protein [Bacteroidota bacterium]